MAALTYSSRFTNVDKWDGEGSYKGILIAGKLNQKNGEDYKLIDAIDIGWNGAWIKSFSTYINTTDELLNIIDRLNRNNEVDSLVNNVNSLNQTVQSISTSYITKDNLSDILAEYQSFLKPGAYIKIDDDFNISAYNLLSTFDAENLYTSKVDFVNLSNNLNQNYYTKPQTNSVIDEIINSTIIKGADKNYNDLEKISNWILSQSRFEKIDYEDIVNDGNTVYYIYDSINNTYNPVTENYITNNPEEQYYILKDHNVDLSEIKEKITELDNEIGNITYEDGTYTYTGLQEKIKNLQDVDSLIFGNLSLMQSSINIASTKADNAYDMAYNVSTTAYNAYIYSEKAYILANDTYTYVHSAYDLAVEAREIIGNESVSSRYVILSDEELEEIKEYADSHSGDPGIITYALSSDGDYIQYYNSNAEILYKFVEGTKSTGFYNRIENVETVAAEAKSTAESSLFNLSTKSEGSTYSKITISPDFYESGNPFRVLTLNTQEGIVNPINGLIEQDGIITTVSLKDSLSYISNWNVLQ